MKFHKLFLTNLLCAVCACFVFSQNLKAGVADLACKDCNLIVISLTTLRPKNMNLYGYQLPTTPNINRFFQGSFIFKNAFAPGSYTMPDAISLFYSTSPLAHQFFKTMKIDPQNKFVQNHKSFTQILKENGYETAAITSDEDYEFNPAIGAGFNFYFDRSMYADHGIKFKPMTYSVGLKELVPVANKWLTENKDKKFFLFLQSFDLHCPYTPKGKFSEAFSIKHSPKIPFETECFMNQFAYKKEEYQGKKGYKLLSYDAVNEFKMNEHFFSDADINFLKSRYDAELLQTDFYLKNFLEKINSLKLLKKTIVILMAEHGDNVGENNYFMKLSPDLIANLQNANINFPLVIKHPKQIAPRKMNQQIVQIVDVGPTILGLLNLDIDKKMRGKNLTPTLLTDDAVNEFAYGYSERNDFIGNTSRYFFKLEYVQNTEWKYMKSRKYSLKEGQYLGEESMLFHIGKDKGEKTNLISSEKTKALELQNQLESLRKYYAN